MGNIKNHHSLLCRTAVVCHVLLPVSLRLSPHYYKVFCYPKCSKAKRPGKKDCKYLHLAHEFLPILCLQQPGIVNIWWSEIWIENPSGVLSSLEYFSCLFFLLVPFALNSVILRIGCITCKVTVLPDCLALFCFVLDLNRDLMQILDKVGGKSRWHWVQNYLCCSDFCADILLCLYPYLLMGSWRQLFRMFTQLTS